MDKRHLLSNNLLKVWRHSFQECYEDTSQQRLFLLEDVKPSKDQDSILIILYFQERLSDTQLEEYEQDPPQNQEEEQHFFSKHFSPLCEEIQNRFRSAKQVKCHINIHNQVAHLKVSVQWCLESNIIKEQKKIIRILNSLVDSYMSATNKSNM